MKSTSVIGFGLKFVLIKFSVNFKIDHAWKLSLKIGPNFNVPRETWGAVNKNPTWQSDQ